jgi:hypothetical protein
VVTDPLQVEEIRLMFRQAAAGHPPGFFFREAGFIDAFDNCPHRGRRIFIDIHKTPFLVRGNVANGGLADLRPGIKNGHALEHAIRRMVFPAHADVPHLPPGIDLFDELGDFDIVELRIPAVRLGLHVVPPHILLAFGEQPGGLVRHGTGLTSQTPVDVKHKGELPLRMPLLIGIQHLAS